MKIKFLIGYVGRETAMRTYIEGDEADISPAQALELIGLGVAEAVVEVFGALPEFHPTKERVSKPKKVTDVKNT
jgi:hypothetical protein